MCLWEDFNPSSETLCHKSSHLPTSLFGSPALWSSLFSQLPLWGLPTLFSSSGKRMCRWACVTQESGIYHVGQRILGVISYAARPRVCGMHACTRTCHSLPCDPSVVSGTSSGSKSCGQTCGAPRRDCRHSCTSVCHPLAPCPDVLCEFPVQLLCSCGRITAKVPCDAGGSSGGYHADSVFEASVIQKLPVPLQPVEENGKKVPLGLRKLICGEECAKLERKRVLADAFDISPPNLDALHFGDNSTMSEFLADMFRRDPKWVLSIEERFKSLVLGKSKGSSANAVRVHVF